MVECTGLWIQCPPSFFISIISNLSTPDKPLSIEMDYFSYLIFWSLASPLRIYGVLSLSSIKNIVSSFDAADVIENLSMVIINSNSGQATITFSADTWKMTLYYMYLLERGNYIGMSRRKLFSYWFSLLKIHICFEYVMCLFIPLDWSPCPMSWA